MADRRQGVAEQLPTVHAEIGRGDVQLPAALLRDELVQDTGQRDRDVVDNVRDALQEGHHFTSACAGV